ncbi:MAG: class I SAM-dependent methyltransferase [Nitrospiraceae bacterium]|nr:MAG: class I SAM-dependent methyltransferase [Nitrospiraceae bacterium]
MILNYEHIGCDLCGSANYKVRYRKPDVVRWINQFEFPVVECRDCGLVYVNPRPTPESMAAYYPKGYHSNRDKERHRLRYEVEVSHLPPLNNERVLDIGCAEGDFLMHLKDKFSGIQAFGCDYYSDKVKSPDIKFFNKALNDCNFENSFFDVITAWAVFEHLHYPDKYFAEVHRILKSGGRFIFQVTNSESLFSKKCYSEDIPRHLFHFSKKTLSSYAEKHGFKFRKILYDNSVFDGRGYGAFRILFWKLLNITWEDLYYKNINVFQHAVLKFGSLIDRIVFFTDWERRLGMSGMIIAEFQK